MKNIFGFFVIVICLVPSFGCKKDEIQTPPISEIITSLDYGRNDLTIKVDKHERHFIVHVPLSYNGENKAPLLFMLHGSSGTGEKFWNISGWKEKAEEEGIIAVFPTALEYPIAEKNGRLSTKWASEGLKFEVVSGTEIVDDIPFFYAMIDFLENNLNLNDRRYYISGFSNGGGFVKSRVMVEMADQFAAFSSAGGFGIPLTFNIKGERYPPLHNIVGTLDDNIITNLGFRNEIPLKADSLFKNLNARVNMSNLLMMLGLGSQYSENPNFPETNEIIFSQSKRSQSNEFRLLLVSDMTHKYPNRTNNLHKVQATEVLWPWFMKFEMSQ